MLHPSYNDLMKVVNSSVEQGEEPVVSSRYSIVIATSKRARQIIDGDEALVEGDRRKPLSLAVEEINQAKVNILPEGTEVNDEIMFTDSVELTFIDDSESDSEEHYDEDEEYDEDEDDEVEVEFYEEESEN